MVPFTLHPQPGVPIYEQAVYAAKKAIVSGRLRPGDAFPSVRELSQALRINPNTAHKVVSHLVAEGLIEVRPGLGTFISERAVPSQETRTSLLQTELERIVVQARSLGLSLEEVSVALAEHWMRFECEHVAAGRKA